MDFNLYNENYLIFLVNNLYNLILLTVIISFIFKKLLLYLQVTLKILFMEIGINEEDFLDEVDDFGTDDQAQDIDPQNQNKDDISTSQTTDEPQLEEDFITSLLKSRGIEDRSKIKFEMEEGSIEELDWDSLSNRIN